MEIKNQSKKKSKKSNLKNIQDEEEEEEEEQESNEENEENEENQKEDDENEEKKEMRSFTIELIIHTKVMDNREEIKKCICRNHILNEKYNKKTKEELEQKENIYVEKEIIPSIEIPIIRETNDQNILAQLSNIESPDKFYIKLNDLTKVLQNKGFPMSGSKINIFVNYANNYVYFGTEPIDNKTMLYSFMLEPNKDLIQMKIINYIQKKMLDGYTNSIINTYFRKPIPKPKTKALPSLEIKNVFTPSMTNLDYYAEVSDNDESLSSSLSVISYDEDDSNMPNLPDNEKDEKKKENFRNMTDAHKRERKIGYIIEKVYAWRKLYNGYKDENNNFIKYSLDKAAEKIDVSKKSLDDYLLQIRLGRKHGFDFDKNKYQKIGKLRDYVKEVKMDKPELVKKRVSKKKFKNNDDNDKEEEEEEEEKEDNTIGNKKNIKKRKKKKKIKLI
jgi:hypothetical protein